MDSAALRLVDLLDADAAHPPPAGTRCLILTCGERARTRFRATLSDGSAAIVHLPRGSVLRPGTRLLAETGERVVVIAASEQVYRVGARVDSTDPALDLLRAAYHLGNRHVPVEIGALGIKLERDPVLRDLLMRLNLDVVATFEPFDPEPGAYSGGHRHDSDAEGGATGESLSRDAHAVASHRPHPAP